LKNKKNHKLNTELNIRQIIEYCYNRLAIDKGKKRKKKMKFIERSYPYKNHIQAPEINK